MLCTWPKEIDAATDCAHSWETNPPVSYGCRFLAFLLESKAHHKLNLESFRDLLCHTSGFVYDSSSSLLQMWSKFEGRSAHTFSGAMVSLESST